MNETEFIVCVNDTDSLLMADLQIEGFDILLCEAAVRVLKIPEPSVREFAELLSKGVVILPADKHTRLVAEIRTLRAEKKART